jgi:hypothetical protein
MIVTLNTVNCRLPVGVSRSLDVLAAKADLIASSTVVVRLPGRPMGFSRSLDALACPLCLFVMLTFAMRVPTGPMGFSRSFDALLAKGGLIARWVVVVHVFRLFQCHSQQDLER